MKQKCPKTTIYLFAFILSLCILLILLNLPTPPQDEFLKIIPFDEDLHFENYPNIEHNIHYEKLRSIKLFNLHIDLISKPSPCEKTDEILAVFVITSYFGNVETRASIRKGFSNLLEKNKLKTVFSLGQAPKDKYTTQKAIENESKRFGDLLQGNFMESYKNLTFKHLMSLKWAGTECSTAKYIIKMDDDTVVNIKGFSDLLKVVKLPKKLLAGYILRKMPAIREPRNKWYVTDEEFKDKIYPNFLSGWLYVTNPVTATLIVAAANGLPYFWIDDAFVTGIVAKKLGVIHFELKEYFLANPEHMHCCFKDMEERNIICEFLVGSNGGDNNLFSKFNEALDSCVQIKCQKRVKMLNVTCKIDYGVENMENRGSPVVEDFRLF